jgi:nitrile hydratase accessory protein
MYLSRPEGAIVKDRVAEPAVADMTGSGALPRRSGEMVFHDEWERRAFAMAVALHEKGLFRWEAFQRALIAAIREAEARHPNTDPAAPGYYEHWLRALETVLGDGELLADQGVPPLEHAG